MSANPATPEISTPPGLVTLDLRAILLAATAKVINSGEIEKAIEIGVASAVKESVKSSLSTYSEFGKAVDVAVKNAMKFDPNQVGLTEYNSTICGLIKAAVEGATNNAIQKQVVEVIDELLQAPPKSIALSELVKTFVKEVADDAEEPGEITFSCEESHGFLHIHMDEKPGKRTYECDIQFDVTRDGWVYAVKIRGDQAKQLFAGPYYGMERLLFQLRAAKSVIVDDRAKVRIETEYEGRFSE